MTEILFSDRQTAAATEAAKTTTDLVQVYSISCVCIIAVKFNAVQYG